MFLAVAVCVIPGCFMAFDEDAPGSLLKSKTVEDPSELTGPHYAKLNSIGCLICDDMEIAQSAKLRSDFDTIDHLVREKRCFVIPTDKDVFINERVKGEIVSAKVKDSALSFYTVRSSLVAK